MAKTLALIFGAILILVGLLGFVGNPLVGTGALFETDSAHNILHVLIGLILLAVALWYSGASALWLKIIGIVFLLLAIIGFLSISGMGQLLGLVEINDADNWLHLVLGIVLLLAGIYAKDEGQPMKPGMPMTTPGEGM